MVLVIISLVAALAIIVTWYIVTREDFVEIFPICLYWIICFLYAFFRLKNTIGWQSITLLLFFEEVFELLIKSGGILLLVGVVFILIHLVVDIIEKRIKNPLKVEKINKKLPSDYKAEYRGNFFYLYRGDDLEVKDEIYSAIEDDYFDKIKDFLRRKEKAGHKTIGELLQDISFQDVKRAIIKPNCWWCSYYYDEEKCRKDVYCCRGFDEEYKIENARTTGITGKEYLYEIEKLYKALIEKAPNETKKSKIFFPLSSHREQQLEIMSLEEMLSLEYVNTDPRYGYTGEDEYIKDISDLLCFVVDNKTLLDKDRGKGNEVHKNGEKQ